MLEPHQFFLLIIAVIAAVFIYQSLKLRERANTIARNYCERRSVQFLDGSVGFGTIGVARENGRWLMRRVYVFDFSDDRMHRQHGAIIFLNGEYHSLLLLSGE